MKSDKLQIRPAHFPLEADAEETIDHQIPAPAGGDVREGRAGGILPCVHRRSRILGESRRVAMEGDGDIEPPALQMARDDERIAAVVTRAGEHQHRVALPGNQLARELGGSEAGTLHQIRRVGRGGDRRLDRANLASEVYGREIVVWGRNHRATVV